MSEGAITYEAGCCRIYLGFLISRYLKLRDQQITLVIHLKLLFTDHANICQQWESNKPFSRFIRSGRVTHGFVLVSFGRQVPLSSLFSMWMHPKRGQRDRSVELVSFANGFIDIRATVLRRSSHSSCFCRKWIYYQLSKRNF